MHCTVTMSSLLVFLVPKVVETTTWGVLGPWVIHQAHHPPWSASMGLKKNYLVTLLTTSLRNVLWPGVWLRILMQSTKKDNCLSTSQPKQLKPKGWWGLRAETRTMLRTQHWSQPTSSRQIPTTMPRIRRLNARFKNRSNRVTQKDIRKQDSSPRCCRLSPILWFVSATIIIISGSIFGYVRWNAQPTSALSNKKAKSDKLDTSSLQNCTISFVPPPPRQEPEWRKPLWIPSFPSSGSASPR